jgi:hypothetical protein
MVSKKSFIVHFEFFVWGMVLTTATLVMVHITRWYQTFQPEFNEYFYMVLAGATGGVWGYGLNVAYDLAKKLKGEYFEYVFWHRILWLIISIIVIAIISIRVTLN